MASLHHYLFADKMTIHALPDALQSILSTGFQVVSFPKTHGSFAILVAFTASEHATGYVCVHAFQIRSHGVVHQHTTLSFIYLSFIDTKLYV